ncbi:MAG TPA: response regulator [Chromatiaceae bacterium]|jgi:CheY-like chemotaxis protein|nr:response regulator [Chromatiaceae bacterium]HIN82504.1 response regulator [Chromatiales bacterium]
MIGSPAGPWNILLVDDRPENLGFVRDSLEHGGHQVRTALEGPEALRMMEEAPPDFVLLDLEMPGMNGMEVLRSIRKAERLADVMVIIMSAHSPEEVEDECLEAGANRVMSKPVRLHLLREVLSALGSKE